MHGSISLTQEWMIERQKAWKFHELLHIYGLTRRVNFSANMAILE